MDIGPRIKTMRTAAGMTQQQCAQLSRTRQSQWSAWESGKLNPTLRILERVAAALGVTVSELLLED